MAANCSREDRDLRLRWGFVGRVWGEGFGEKSALLGGSGGGVCRGFLAGKVEGVREPWRILGSNSALLGGMLLGEGRECFGGTGGGAVES